MQDTAGKLKKQSHQLETLAGNLVKAIQGTDWDAEDKHQAVQLANALKKEAHELSGAVNNASKFTTDFASATAQTVAKAKSMLNYST
ncbi:MAG TPA: hypothetical protein VE172_01835 [Stackebrandtia sp.]|uniref:hypothetical protein n=1 Tax=Stackebrandtia sp. TaxID=2023065 RepID=UPI002D647F08|nr:hypothetical protein [Stackebrandtia sp.]HZE37526.1 hypothetical protein [Stackebrandtia sp.]